MLYNYHGYQEEMEENKHSWIFENYIACELAQQIIDFGSNHAL